MKYLVLELPSWIEIYEQEKETDHLVKIVLSFSKIGNERNKDREGKVIDVKELWRGTIEVDDPMEKYFDCFL